MAKGYSLHIGVNRCDADHYEGWDGALDFCEADAEATHAIACQLGYDSSRLLTSEATLAGVSDAIHAAAAMLVPGDIFFVSYAGHGGQIPDQKEGDVYRDETDDRRDETWCLYDGQLSDDEMDVLYSEFQPGVRVLIVSDSCHSGTVSRGSREQQFAGMTDAERVATFGTATPKFRLMPRDFAKKVYKKNRVFYDGRIRALPVPKPELRASVLLLSGCRDDELSREVSGHGLFTQALLDVWDDGRFTGNYRDFYEAITARMPGGVQRPNWFRTGEPDPAFENARPFRI